MRLLAFKLWGFDKHFCILHCQIASQQARRDNISAHVLFKKTRRGTREEQLHLLTLEPLIQDLLSEVQLGLPQPHPLLKGANVWGCSHALSLHYLVIQQSLDVIKATQDECASCTPFQCIKRYSCPIRLNEMLYTQLQAVLLCGRQM